MKNYKKCIIGAVLILSCILLLSACRSAEVDNPFSWRELKKADVYAHMYLNLYYKTKETYEEWDTSSKKNNFLKMTDKIASDVVESLSRVEIIRPFDEGEVIDYTKGDPFLMLQKRDTRYIFYFYDAHYFISLHSEHRYYPFLWVEKIKTQRDGSEISQAWHCALNAADYAKVINKAYNSGDNLDIIEIPMGLESITLNFKDILDWKYEGEPPLDRESLFIESEALDEEILREAKLMVFENAMNWFYYRDDPAYCKIVEDDALRGEIIRIMMSGQAYSPEIGLSEMIIAGGDGEPSIVFFQEMEGRNTTYTISFSMGAGQLNETYLYYDEPVVSISKTVREKEGNYYKATGGFNYRYILSPEDYRWLYELTQYNH